MRSETPQPCFSTLCPREAGVAVATPAFQDGHCSDRGYDTDSSSFNTRTYLQPNQQQPIMYLVVSDQVESVVGGLTQQPP